MIIAFILCLDNATLLSLLQPCFHSLRRFWLFISRFYFKIATRSLFRRTLSLLAQLWHARFESLHSGHRFVRRKMYNYISFWKNCCLKRATIALSTKFLNKHTLICKPVPKKLKRWYIERKKSNENNMFSYIILTAWFFGKKILYIYSKVCVYQNVNETTRYFYFSSMPHNSQADNKIFIPIFFKYREITYLDPIPS